jgi:hypothetical protein
MIVIMGSAADLEKKQEEDDKFYRFVLQKTLAALLPILGIRFHKRALNRSCRKADSC